MLQKSKWIILLISCLMLSSCGFHLRSYQESLRHLIPVIWLKPSGSLQLYQRLRFYLDARKIKVFEEEPNILAPQLAIISEDLVPFPLVYGPEGDLRRERLKMTVVFSFCDKESKIVTLSTERDRQLISSQRLGDDAEKVIIEQEMQIDIIQQLLRYLATQKLKDEC